MIWNPKGELQPFAPREKRVHTFCCVPATNLLTLAIFFGLALPNQTEEQPFVGVERSGQRCCSQEFCTAAAHM